MSAPTRNTSAELYSLWRNGTLGNAGLDIYDAPETYHELRTKDKARWDLFTAQLMRWLVGDEQCPLLRLRFFAGAQEPEDVTELYRKVSRNDDGTLKRPGVGPRIGGRELPTEDSPQGSSTSYGWGTFDAVRTCGDCGQTYNFQRGGEHVCMPVDDAWPTLHEVVSGEVPPAPIDYVDDAQREEMHEAAEKEVISAFSRQAVLDAGAIEEALDGVMMGLENQGLPTGKADQLVYFLRQLPDLKPETVDVRAHSMLASWGWVRDGDGPWHYDALRDPRYGEDGRERPLPRLATEKIDWAAEATRLYAPLDTPKPKTWFSRIGAKLLGR